MKNNNKEIQELVKKAQEELETSPETYKKKLLAYSLLGYSIILLIVLLLVGLSIGSVYLALSSSVVLLLLLQKKLFIPLLIMLWVLFKSVFIRWPKPEGLVVSKTDAPKLFDHLNEITTKLQCEKLHQVIITPENNAAIIQTPRFIAFGFTHNTLVLGFELLATLTFDEVKSVIAHELGHLSGNHSKFHAWIYQVRNSWQNMMFNLDQHNSWTTAPIRKFFNWYSPRFSAYSFALARLNEYEADRIASELTSPAITASALIKTQCYARFIENNYWSSFREGVLYHPKPQKMPYVGLLDFLHDIDIPQEEAHSTLEFAFKEKTNYLNTHPSLSDRLASLKQRDIQFEATQVSAASSIFSDKFSSIAEQLDHQWAEEAIPLWEEEYQQIQQEKKQLKDLESLDSDTLTPEQEWQIIALGEKFNRIANPLEHYQAYLEKHPKDPLAALAVGRLMLEAKQDEGLDYLKLAIKKDELIEIVSMLAYDYLVASDRSEEANNWLSNVQEMEAIYRKAAFERINVKAKELIEPDDFDEQKYADILQQLKQHKKVKHVWVAQKKLHYMQDSPFFIFAIKEKSGFYLSDNLASKIMKNITIPEGVTLLLILKSDDAKLFKQTKKIGRQII